MIRTIVSRNIVKFIISLFTVLQGIARILNHSWITANVWVSPRTAYVRSGMEIKRLPWRIKEIVSSFKKVSNLSHTNIEKFTFHLMILTDLLTFNIISSYILHFLYTKNYCNFIDKRGYFLPQGGLHRHLKGFFSFIANIYREKIYS